MIHFGDITKLNGADLPLVDIITGGSPCQDLSVAGKRAGLAGERSGLFMEQIRIVKEMRENDRKERRSNGRTDEHIRLRTRYMVWENVPGAFSSNKGEDFRAVLEETAKVADENAVIPRPPKKWEPSGCILGDGWSIAWRTHDAQYWGVPQRRKRICMVADFDGDTAWKILFDVQLRGEAEYNEYFQTIASAGAESESKIQSVSESVSGDSEPGKSERKSTSEDIERSIGASSYAIKIGADVHNGELTGDTYVPMVMQAIGEYKESESASSLKMRDYKDATDLIVSYGLDRASYNQGANAQYDFSVEKEMSATQVAKGPGAVASFYPQMKAESQCWREDDVSNTLVNGTNPGFQNGIVCSVVRRLTPLECERLQGYPDGWTNIGEWTDSKGKKHKDADSPRYKALGNSIALPFWQWMAARMVKCLWDDGITEPTMASLFDGISGFCLCFKRVGCEPKFTSEIEDFPIAVCKRHFGDEETGEEGDINDFL